MSTIDLERRAAGEGALLHLRPDLGALVVTGKDRLTWLNGLVTCELAGRKPGDGVYGLAVGKTGKIFAELWFVVAADHVAVAVPADRVEALREHLDKHLIMEDAEMEIAADRAWIAAHGPEARALVELGRAEGADAAMVDFTGRGDAAMILAPAGGAEALAKALLDRAGDRGAVATAEGWEALRIEWGVPRFGADYDDQTLPQEASLERLAVSFSKGCYLGQEAVFMLEKRGHAKKRLMRLSIEGEPPARGAEIVLPDGTAVGTVTSVYAQDGGARALGYVKFKHAQPGAELSVGGRPARAIGLAAEPSHDGAASGPRPQAT